MYACVRVRVMLCFLRCVGNDLYEGMCICTFVRVGVCMCACACMER